jgi:Holliday junction DNA helicase RuvA
MIAHIRGRLVERHPTDAVVEVGGIGLHCHISLATFAVLPDVGEEVELVTAMVVREDSIDLYGFAEKAERALFELLQGVSGVGPRMAQGILSGLTVEEFARAIATEDLVALTAIKGVGRKTAERLVLELKDRLAQLEEFSLEPVSVPEGGAVSPSWEEEAVLALRSLGYATQEAERAVSKAARDLEEEPTVEIIVKRALTLAR